jgi:uncharacterized protein
MGGHRSYVIEPARRQRLLICIVMFTLATVAFPGTSLCDGLFVSVGSGASSGVYYKVAKALCALVNRDPPATGIWCSPEATPGSVYNLQRLKSGELDFAIVQSDVQFDAFTGNDAWAGNAFKKLRSVLSLHPELMTIIARSGSGIEDLNGLRRRRLNVGSFGSGTRATWDALESSLGWEPDAGVRKSALKPDATTNLLCTGDLDASLLLVGHPSAFVQRQISTCRTTLVALDGAQIDRFLSGHPYYQRGMIAASTYGLEHDVQTFGVKATLVTSADVEDKVVFALVKAVLSNFEEFKRSVPALETLQVSQLMKEALTAPLHPGAQRGSQEPKLERGAAVQ